jgi:predicted CopG family antitoxin
MKTVEVDDDAYDMLMDSAKYGETFSIMLRRILAERKEAIKQCNELMLGILEAMTKDIPKRKQPTGFNVPVEGSDSTPI